jgi:glycosyltransferase involved in cell wall biosynthesis
LRKNELVNDVSIIIPTHNSSGTIRACLESVKRQSYPLREVIIADNFSEDETTDIAKEFGVTIMERCGKLGNPGSARNVGIRKSSGKYVLLLDSDERLARDTVQNCISRQEEENVGMIKIPLFFVGTDFWGKCSAYYKNCNYLVNKQTIGSIPRFFLKNVIMRAGLFDENLTIGEDWELYTRLKRNGVKEAYSSSRILHHEPSSISKIMARELRYSTFIHLHSQRFKKEHMSLFKNSLLSLKEALKGFRRYPQLVAGSLILLFVKSCIWAIKFTFF